MQNNILAQLMGVKASLLEEKAQYEAGLERVNKELDALEVVLNSRSVIDDPQKDLIVNAHLSRQQAEIWDDYFFRVIKFLKGNAKKGEIVGIAVKYNPSESKVKIEKAAEKSLSNLRKKNKIGALVNGSKKIGYEYFLK